jgi:hypothetical protein
LFERVSRYRPQTFQGQIAFSRALHEFFGDIFAALMVSAVQYPCESLFQRHVHVGGGAFVEFRHPSSSLTAGIDRGRLRSGVAGMWLKMLLGCISTAPTT